MAVSGIADFFEKLITILLGTGALFGILQFFNEQRKRKDGAEYLATRIAILLEGYTIDCANKISEYDLIFSTNGILGELLFDIPKLPDIPEGDYKLLNRSLLDEFLQLPQDIEMAQNIIIHEREFVDVAGEIRIRIRQLTGVGIKAITLARHYRRKYKLLERNIKVGKVDIKDFLNRE